jgi:hypothetical protein
MEFPIGDIDPNSLKKDQRFAEYFKIGLITEKGCEKCDSRNELNRL